MVTLASLLFVTALLARAIVEAHPRRSAALRKRFLASLGLTHTPRGCQVDHWIALTCGGADTVENLRLICGQYMVEKEQVEQHCDEAVAWKREHPCDRNQCFAPRRSP